MESDFNYKEHSLKNLKSWLQDALDACTGQEIYDTINEVVKESYYYHKNELSKAEDLMVLMNNQQPNTFNLVCDGNDTSEECQKAYQDFWNSYSSPMAYEEKPIKWITPVDFDDLTGDCFVKIPPEILEVLGFAEGDLLEWVDNKDGSFTVKKYIKSQE